MKLGSREVSYISLSDFDLNNEKSNFLSKGRSSRNNHSSGHELALINGVWLAELSSFLDFLEIKLGLSNNGAGFASRLALV